MLLRCPQILNSSSYQCILDDGLRDMYDREFVLMHDDAPCHRSHATELYWERKKICYISDWSPQLSDLNLIENMWSILKTNVTRKFPRTVDEVWKIAQEEWYRIDNGYIYNLYASIPRRLEVVIKMKGYHSKYWNIFMFAKNILVYKYMWFRQLHLLNLFYKLWPITFVTMKIFYFLI